MNEPAGLDAPVLKKITGILLSMLESKSDYKISVFGSRANDRYRKYSDVDLWIESSPPLNAREISDLLEKFEESDLAFRVDLVTPENCLPDYFTQIQKEKKLWLEKSRP